MPITQSRMLDLIDAAESVTNTYYRFREIIVAVLTHEETAEDGRIRKANTLASNPAATVDDMRKACTLYWETITALRSHIRELPIGAEAIRTVERERTHFRINRRKNELNALSQRQSRVRHTAPEPVGDLFNPTSDFVAVGSQRQVQDQMLRSGVVTLNPAPVSPVEGDDPRAAYERDRAARRLADASGGPLTVKTPTKNGE